MADPSGKARSLCREVHSRDHNGHPRYVASHKGLMCSLTLLTGTKAAHTPVVNMGGRQDAWSRMRKLQDSLIKHPTVGARGTKVRGVLPVSE